MKSESLDWKKLAGDVTPDTTKIPYESNKHLFRKVAFDVFKLNGSPVESLWTLEDGDDGTQYLVARYTEEEPELETKSHWKALADSKGKNVTLLYKDTPIQRFASADYGFNSEDAHLFQQSLIDLLNSNPEFVAKVLKSQPKERLGILAQHYPELQALAADYPGHPDDPDIGWDYEPIDQGNEVSPVGYSDEEHREYLGYFATKMTEALYKALQEHDQENPENKFEGFSDMDKRYIIKHIEEELLRQ